MPFDPDVAPWDATLITGLAGDKAALLLRAHHVLTDGLGGASMVALLLDESEAPARRTVSVIRSHESAGSPAGDGERPFRITIDLPRRPRRLPSGLSTIFNGERTGVLVRGVQRSLDVADSVSRQALVASGPLGSWPGTRSTGSRFEILSIPGARGAAHALGGSRNTLLVAVAASGIGLYLERLGRPCPELRLATSASLRHSSQVGGNWFAPLRLEVPTSLDHPAPQFGVVAERLARARREPALALTSALAATIARLPIGLLIPALHAQADTVDFAATTLPGSRAPRHLCGATIEQSFPFGPRLGCPVNITAFGNQDRLDLGIVMDPATVESDVLLDCLQTAFSRFIPPARPLQADSAKNRPSSAVA